MASKQKKERKTTLLLYLSLISMTSSFVLVALGAASYHAVDSCPNNFT